MEYIACLSSIKSKADQKSGRVIFKILLQSYNPGVHILKNSSYAVSWVTLISYQPSPLTLWLWSGSKQKASQELSYWEWELLITWWSLHLIVYRQLDQA